MKIWKTFVGRQAPASKLHRKCISTGAYCCILRRTTTYCQVLRRTTTYYDVRPGTTAHYAVLRDSGLDALLDRHSNPLKAREPDPGPFNPKPSPKYEAPTNRHTKIPNNSGPISACFDDYPKLLHCEIAQPSPWGSSGAGGVPGPLGGGVWVILPYVSQYRRLPNTPPIEALRIVRAWGHGCYRTL